MRSKSNKMCATWERKGRWIACYRTRAGWRIYAGQPVFTSRYDCYQWIMKNKLNNNPVQAMMSITERGATNG